jgi:hypothetical protein
VLSGVDVLSKAHAYRPQVLDLLGLPPAPPSPSSGSGSTGARLPHDGELCAMASLCCACPRGLVLVLDTYDCMRSGLPNVMALCLALHDAKHSIQGIPTTTHRHRQGDRKVMNVFGMFVCVGVRLANGDLAYVSLRVREAFTRAEEEWGGRQGLWRSLTIMGSSELHEGFLLSLAKTPLPSPLDLKLTRLRRQSSSGSTGSTGGGEGEGGGGRRHGMDSFGIGTHLVTCQVPHITTSQHIPSKKRPARPCPSDRRLLCLCVWWGVGSGGLGVCVQASAAVWQSPHQAEQ